MVDWDGEMSKTKSHLNRTEQFELSEETTKPKEPSKTKLI